MRIPSTTVAMVLAAGLCGFAQTPPPDRQSVPRTWPPEVYLNDLGCAPHLTFSKPATTLQVTGSTEPDRHLIFSKGQKILIAGGTSGGVQPGQEYFVRRMPKRFGARGPDFDHPISVHTVGWVKILSAEDTVATAAIVHACDAMSAGDYLEPFAAPAAQTILDGQIRYDNLARLLAGDEDRSTIGVNQYMTLDRGSDHGLKPGTRFVILRDKKEGPLVEIGEGVVLQVRAQTSTVQVTRARDAIYAGDFVALVK